MTIQYYLNSKAKFVFFLLCIIIFTKPVTAQSDKAKFAKTFHAEKTAAQARYTEQEKNRPFLFAPPWTVPDWVKQFKNYGDTISYMIGISDPGLDSADAVKQAKLRAISLHLILKKAKIKNLTDYYSNEIQNVNTEMYEYFSSAETTARIPKYQVVQFGFTNFGEAIVILRFNSNPLPDPDWGSQLKIYTDLYKGEIQYFDKSEHNDALRLTVINEKGDTIMHFSSNQYDKDYDMSSYMNGKEMLGFRYPFVYVTAGTDVTNLEKSYLQGGLWRCFYKSTLNQMMTLSHAYNSVIEKMGDRFANNDTFEKLTRTKSVNMFSFRLNSFSIQPTFIDVDMKGNPAN